MTRKIITSYVNPPIPSRSCDWCAYFDGEEEAGNYGYGATEAEAIGDFVGNCLPAHVALEMLSLAETRRRDPELALLIAEQSASQSTVLIAQKERA